MIRILESAYQAQAVLNGQMTLHSNRPGASSADVEVRAEPRPDFPMLVLPSGEVTITQCATDLFSRIGPAHKLFNRGGVVTKLARQDTGQLVLEHLTAAEARSLFEKHGRLFAWRSGPGGQLVLKPTVCPHDMADALLQSQEAKLLLPNVTGLVNCPIITERTGALRIAGPGYDDQTGFLITGGQLPPAVGLEEAVNSLLGLLAEFHFQSDGDKSRAIASLIAPALKLGGFIQGRVPADVAEADKSQSGKTYRQKINTAIYGETLALVTNKEGGVGSIDETLDQQLIAGRPFIQFDNFRGRFGSQHLEAFMTAEGVFGCRIPYRAEVKIRPEHFFIMLSSNGVDTTRDFANRSSIIKIRKQEGYAYREYPEGDLLAHVKANQPYYLGCVFAVVRAWHAAGKPRTKETRHDFRDWCQKLDWVVQNVFRAVPLMDGHQQAQERVSNPALVFVRAVVLAADKLGELGRELFASSIAELCETASIPVPGLAPDAGEDRAKKVIGGIMSKVFGDGNEMEVDGFIIRRFEKMTPRSDGRGTFASKTYVITRQGCPAPDADNVCPE